MMTEDEFKKMIAPQCDKLFRRADRILAKGNVPGYIQARFQATVYAYLMATAYQKAKKEVLLENGK